MDKILVIQKDKDGFTSISDLSWKNITIQTPNTFPLIRSQRPNELDLLMYEKAKNNFEHIDGCVIKLLDAPNILYNRVDKISQNTTIDGSEPQDIFSKFRRANFIVPDPASEYLFKYKEDYDKKLLNAFSDITKITNYIAMYKTNKKNSSDKGFKKIRRKLYEDLWLDSSKSGRKQTGAMLTRIMNKEFEYFGYGVPFTPVCTEEPSYMERAIEANDTCQAISYSQDKECASMFIIHKNALKNDGIMDRYYEYIRENQWATLNIVKFYGLDLHELDFEAREKFFEFMTTIAEIKEEHPKKTFMLLEAGNQGFLSMQVFDIISHSLNGIDGDVDFGRGGGIGRWWDEKLYAARPAKQSFKLVNRDHCYICQNITQEEFSEPIFNTKRRIHRLYDMDIKASGICNSVKSKNVVIHMMNVLGNSEFSSFSEYLINQ